MSIFHKRPTTLLWPGFWHEMFRYADADQRAQTFLGKLKAAGVRHVLVPEQVAHIPDRTKWTVEQIRKAGLRVGLCISAAHHDWQGVGALYTTRNPDPKVFHTSHVPGKNDRRGYCPGYRGERYTEGYLERLKWYVEATKSEVVCIVDEVWLRPESVERSLPGEIDACEHCGSPEAYNALHRAVVDDVERVVKRIVPKSRVYYFNDLAWWPDKTGDAPCPAFYNFNDWNPTYPLVELQKQVTENPYWREEHPPKYRGFKNGYPWLTPYRGHVNWTEGVPCEELDPSHEDYPLHTPDEFHAICEILHKAKARGISMWPGPLGIWKKANGSPLSGRNRNHSEYWEDRLIELVKIGVDVVDC